ncbi:hypothetical protein [Pseudobacteriovorax antillogorgiicola]|uniref:Uncharacterized protein n=1 Tax=Pseudobacteriovorax antillogorgiicola TaxID=1513793 RepID=A0A1Y6CUI0_9BACT|nr:hypothetical protein [Pseudobacteriovorax antillogorgiicola]TCS45192.1 hypothetical protein EDD56_12926 [Pseudobacteriovorax antillogorgiicola]SMF75617.1 hypothetical protein SAMN06296036_12954 [Pseudobacteriovorax antillogorgiicola]
MQTKLSKLQWKFSDAQSRKFDAFTPILLLSIAISFTLHYGVKDLPWELLLGTAPLIILPAFFKGHIKHYSILFLVSGYIVFSLMLPGYFHWIAKTLGVASLCAMFLILVSKAPSFLRKTFKATLPLYIVANFMLGASIFWVFLRPYRLDRWPDAPLEALKYGVINVDHLYHLAISSMVLSEGVPSIGVHEVLYRHFHVLQHFFQASMTAASGLESYLIYPVVIIFVIAPLVISSLEGLLQALKVPSYLIFLSFFFFYGLSSADYLNRDESNLLSYSILYIFLGVVVARGHTFLGGVFIFLGFLAKNATGVAVAGLACFWTFKLLVDRKYVQFTITLLLNLLVTYVSIQMTSVNYGGNGTDFGFLQSYFNMRSRFSGPFDFLWTYFNLSLVISALLLFIVLCRRSLKPVANFMSVSWLLVFGYTLLAINAATPGLTIGHVFSVSFWIGLPLIIKIVHDLCQENAFSLYIVIGIFLGCSWNIFGKASNAIESYESQQEARATNFEAMKSRNLGLGKYVEVLSAISSYEKSGSFLVEIDQASKFWSFYPHWTGTRYVMPFYVPILAKMPGWNGYNHSTMKSTGLFWGYQKYAQNPLVGDPCKLTGRDGVFKVFDSESGPRVSFRACKAGVAVQREELAKLGK